MPKILKQVSEVLDRARKNGSATKKPYDAKYFKKPYEGIRLYHYGTLIFDFNMDMGRIVELGGYSSSDQNAISTAMRKMGLYAYVSKSEKFEGKGHPKMRGWYIIAN